jgi:hypothetical protein
VNNALVFYAGQLLIEIPIGEFKEWARSMCHGDPEVYNGAWVYGTSSPRHVPGAAVPIPPQSPDWYRMDGTPALKSDVPKDIQTLVLLLT